MAARFGDHAQVLNPKNLHAAVLAVQLRGDSRRVLPRPAGLEEEVEILSQVIPLAKSAVRQRARRRRPDAAQDRSRRHGRYTVDTPVPYRLSDLVA